MPYEEELDYGGLMFVQLLAEPGEEGEEFPSGLFVNVHEVIALLRYEAILAEVGYAVGETVERTDDCLNSIADALAEQAVDAEERFGGE